MSADEKQDRTKWFVYIVQCADLSLYTGVTTDLERRLTEHNNSALGAKYTQARRPVTLVYHEQLATRSLAQKREWAIKKSSRHQKLQLVTLSQKKTIKRSSKGKPHE